MKNRAPGFVKVEMGDTLGKIAQRVFGGDWRGLFAINRDTILAEQYRRGIRREHISDLIKGAGRVPPVEAHLIYPGTILRTTPNE